MRNQTFNNKIFFKLTLSLKLGFHWDSLSSWRHVYQYPYMSSLSLSLPRNVGIDLDVTAMWETDALCFMASLPLKSFTIDRSSTLPHKFSWIQDVLKEPVRFNYCHDSLLWTSPESTLKYWTSQILAILILLSTQRQQPSQMPTFSQPT